MVFTMHRRPHLLLLALLACALAAPWAHAAESAGQKFPDVLAAKVQARTSERFDFDVTISSPYDTAQRYADAFRVMHKDGSVYAQRLLLHDHASEQPFTRDLYGVRVPRGVGSVVIQGRDQQHGWGGKTIEVALPGR